MNNLYAFSISLFAGLTTILGSFMIFLKNRDKIIKYSLWFCSGVIISICLFDLLPNSYININKYFEIIPTLLFMGIFITIGIIIDITIDKSITNSNNLYKIGILSTIAMILHNVPEGIITFITSIADAKLGIKLAIIIALHNIPEGILISIPIYYSSSKKYKAILLTTISGLSEFLGALLAYKFINYISSYTILGLLFALISGLMLYIAVYEIPLLLKNYDKKGRVVSFILGFVLIVFNHFILN